MEHNYTALLQTTLGFDSQLNSGQLIQMPVQPQYLQNSIRIQRESEHSYWSSYSQAVQMTVSFLYWSPLLRSAVNLWSTARKIQELHS